jgi:hypothetical protein
LQLIWSECAHHIWQCKALCDGTAHGVQCAHVNIYWV